MPRLTTMTEIPQFFFSQQIRAWDMHSTLQKIPDWNNQVVKSAKCYFQDQKSALERVMNFASH